MRLSYSDQRSFWDVFGDQIFIGKALNARSTIGVQNQSHLLNLTSFMLIEMAGAGAFCSGGGGHFGRIGEEERNNRYYNEINDIMKRNIHYHPP